MNSQTTAKEESLNVQLQTASAPSLRFSQLQIQKGQKTQYFISFAGTIFTPIILFHFHLYFRYAVSMFN